VLIQLSLPTPIGLSWKLVRNITVYSLGILFAVKFNADFDPLGMYQSSNEPSDRILVTLKTLKIISLGLIFLESIEPLVYSANLKATGFLYRFAQLSAVVCLLVVIALVATTMSDRLYTLSCEFVGCENKEAFKIFFDMGMSVFPLLVFAFVNITFMWRLEKGSSLYKAAFNYFYTVNMPSVVSILLVTVLAWMMLADNNVVYVYIFNSGAIALLIFMTLCLSFYAETVTHSEHETDIQKDGN